MEESVSQKEKERAEEAMIEQAFQELPGTLFSLFTHHIGFLYRLAMIPMIFTMCVAFFIVHGNDPFAFQAESAGYLEIGETLYLGPVQQFPRGFVIQEGVLWFSPFPLVLYLLYR